MMVTQNEITYEIQNNPDIDEFSNLITKAFEVLAPDDQAHFDAESKNQSLSDWFDVSNLQDYLNHSFLIEARNSQQVLVGVVLIGKQNPLTWPDGNKVEVFVLVVNPQFRGQGIGSTLMNKADSVARDMGAQKIILNTHILLTATHKYYEKLGFVKIGILKKYYGNGDAVFYSKDLI